MKHKNSLSRIAIESPEDGLRTYIIEILFHLIEMYCYLYFQVMFSVFDLVL